GGIDRRVHRVRKENAFRALFEYTLELRRGNFERMLPRDHAHTNQPLRIDRTEVFEQPVIEGLQTLQREFAVREAGVRAIHHLGVDHRGVDTIRCHVLEVSRAIVIAGYQLLPAQPAWRDADARTGIHGTESPRQRDGAVGDRAVEAPTVTAILSTHHTGRLIA